ncbi:transcription elongation factor GreA [Candidatus Saccharibacteria bacterium]|nr:MAG: transcription elongation factor GreA [Candidatus Saccharibacteria bacterium]
MMKKLYQITAEGKKELEKELDELKAQRGEVAEKIANARDYGDLSENAEYDAARELQNQVESRIADIEDILQNATIIKPKDGASSISVGCTVVLQNDGKRVTYTLVGPVEANPLEGKISDESPIGQALLGKTKGSIVEIETPKGKTTYEIVEIK